LTAKPGGTRVSLPSMQTFRSICRLSHIARAALV
jgi:hypothetical protein